MELRRVKVVKPRSCADIVLVMGCLKFETM